MGEPVATVLDSMHSPYGRAKTTAGIRQFELNYHKQKKKNNMLFKEENNVLGKAEYVTISKRDEL